MRLTWGWRRGSRRFMRLTCTTAWGSRTLTPTFESSNTNRSMSQDYASSSSGLFFNLYFPSNIKVQFMIFLCFTSWKSRFSHIESFILSYLCIIIYIILYNVRTIYSICIVFSKKVNILDCVFFCLFHFILTAESEL